MNFLICLLYEAVYGNRLYGQCQYRNKTVGAVETVHLNELWPLSKHYGCDTNLILDPWFSQPIREEGIKKIRK